MYGILLNHCFARKLRLRKLFLIMNSDEVMSVELTLEYYKSAVHKMFTPGETGKTVHSWRTTIKPGAYRYHSVLFITDYASVTD